MTPFESLSLEDRIKIEKYINDNTSGCCVGVEKILAPWNEAKEELFKAFGNKLSVEFPINITRPQEYYIEEMERLCDEYYMPILSPIKNTMWGSNAITDVNGLSTCYKLANPENLVKGIYDGENIKYNDKVVIKKGMKIMRALSKYISIFCKNTVNMNDFEEFRIKHSRIMNQKNFDSVLHLSIHPLDYMTMSHNDYNWSSCMNWEDGEYRQGTVEMMNSPCVVVGFVSNKTFHTYKGGTNDIEWNDKQIRQLFIVNSDVILGIKSYPYECEEITLTALDKLKEIMNNYYKKDIYDEKIIEFKQGNSFIHNGVTFSADIESDHMYNDIYSTHLSYWNKSVKGRYYLNFSGVSECMICGKTGSEHFLSENLACFECLDYVQCSECGNWNNRDYISMIDGKYVCDDCYDYWLNNDMIFTCHHDGETIKSDNSTLVFI